MLVKLNDLLVLDIIWGPLVLSFFVFFYYIFITREVIDKIVQFNNVPVTKKIRFYKKIFYENYFCLLKFLYKFTLYLYILFFFNNCYIFNYTYKYYYLNFHIHNFVWLYCIILNLIIILTLILLFNYYLNNIKKSFEFLLSTVLFLNCLFYYLILNNLIALVVLFELQSLILIYLLSTNFTLSINFNNLYTLRYNNYTSQPIWYFNSLIYQFWVSFIGALLLIYSSLTLFRSTSFNDWNNVEIYLYIYSNIFRYYSTIQLFFILFPLILGLILKLGSLPFFLWKPEIYKNFNLSILFIYMAVYSFSSLYFIIIFFSNYILLLKYYVYTYIYLISIFTLCILSLIIFSIIEIRPFLAYTSSIHIIFIILGIFLKSVNSLSISFLYLFIYLYFIILFFIILFFFQNNNEVWYFTDLQYFFKNSIIVSGFSIIFLSMAGIPPFLGFFAKLSLISLLLYNEEYLLFFLTLIIGFFISFFYIQNYRFYGYTIKNINYNKNIFILKNNKNLYFIFYIFIFFNIFSCIFINDFFIFATFLSLI